MPIITMGNPRSKSLAVRIVDWKLLSSVTQKPPPLERTASERLVAAATLPRPITKTRVDGRFEIGKFYIRF